MGSSYQIQNQADTYYFTFQVVDWVDIFSRKVYRDCIVDSLNYCAHNKGLGIVAWVIMTNHIHMIAYAQNSNLSDVIRDFKAFTAREILKLIQQKSESRQIWLNPIFNFNALKHGRNQQQQL